ncbi:hypothetical protein C8J57DRAFT_1265095, partial [Mycena rebaudengoi]
MLAQKGAKAWTQGGARKDVVDCNQIHRKKKKKKKNPREEWTLSRKQERPSIPKGIWLGSVGGISKKEEEGLPDWTQVGYEKGSQAAFPATPQLASVYGVHPNDGVDDTAGLQRAIEDNPGTPGAFTLIQLPAGTINLSFTIYISSNYLILRGGPATTQTLARLAVIGGISITPYSVGHSRRSQYPHRGGKRSPANATGGWLWPGRSIFRVGTKDIADKFLKPASMAPPDLVDLFYGSVNYHWRNDSKIKGYMADQTMEIAGFAGTRKVYIDTQNSSWDANIGQDIWIDYDSWQVQDKKFYQNEYMFQDWFTATGTGDDDLGHYIELDHDLEFDVYTNSVTGGSPQMGGETIFTKVMPIVEPVHHVGIENLYMTQPMPSFSVAGRPGSFQFSMTGSHPIATEFIKAARHLQIQDNFFDGSWNKILMGVQGAGGNGYVRGSRVWDSLYYNNTSAKSPALHLPMNMTNDMNMHGGYEGHNLLELNFVSVPYAHRSGKSTGSKASKWSGATGPQNVFYRLSRPAQLKMNISRTSLAMDPCPISCGNLDGHEQDRFMTSPNVGVNGQLKDDYTSLFLRDVTNGTGITTFSEIAGFADCLGKITPKVVGYYLGGAATRSCLPWTPQAIDPSIYS